MREPNNLAGVLLIDAGLAAGFLGLVSLVRPLRGLGLRTRRRGARPTLHPAAGSPRTGA